MEYEDFDEYWQRMKEEYYRKYGSLIVSAYQPMRGPAFQVTDIEPHYTSILTYRTMEQADEAAKEHAQDEGYLYKDMNNQLWQFDEETNEWKEFHAQE